MVGYRDFQRRSNAALIDLDSQNVLRGERSVVDPAMPVAVQIEDRFFERFGLLNEGVEEIGVFLIHIGMAK